MYPAPEDEDEQMSNSDDNKKLKNVITMEDILGSSTNEDQHHLAIEDEEDDDEVYRQQFIAQFKRKEMLDKAREMIIFNGDDDDDKYLMEFKPSGVGSDEEGEDFLEKEKRKAEKKDLKKVDHSLENYEPITKNLYIETKEIGRMSDKEVAEFRKINGEIKVRGLKCPKPINNWYQCGLPDSVLETIEKKQFAKPFPI
jgi:ATP-dependent RNA helicase DDX46/PRP5